jgi:hypothetical protein
MISKRKRALKYYNYFYTIKIHKDGICVVNQYYKNLNDKNYVAYNMRVKDILSDAGKFRGSWADKMVKFFKLELK